MKESLHPFSRIVKIPMVYGLPAAADKADVLVENFRPGVMEKWGLGPKVRKAAACRGQSPHGTNAIFSFFSPLPHPSPSHSLIIFIDIGKSHVE